MVNFLVHTGLGGGPVSVPIKDEHKVKEVQKELLEHLGIKEVKKQRLRQSKTKIKIWIV